MNAVLPDLGTASITARLAAFLTLQLGQPVRIETFHRLTGGLSWITGIFTLRTETAHAFDGRQLVIKLGPPQGLMAPYSARTQAEALRVFAGVNALPVPELFWESDDPAAFGVPFLITSKLEGAALNPFVPGYGIKDPSVLPALGQQFADLLGTIHAVRPAGDLTQRACGAEQVDAWQQRYRIWAGKPYPLVEFAASWLRRHSPIPARAVVVHGDYRVGNFLAAGDRITAILDWEMTHTGDPHEDLCWAMLPELCLSGLIASGDFIARYQARSGIHVLPDSMRYYRIFNLYKLVLINIGGVSGFETGSRDLRMACMGFLVPLYLKRLARALEEVS